MQTEGTGIHALSVRAPSRRALIVAGVLVILGALALAAVLWLRSYAPLQWGGTESYKSAVVAGGTAVVGLDLHNDGMIPVEVERLIPFASPLAPFKPVGLRVHRGAFRGGASFGPTSPAPFTLSAHQSRVVFLHFRVATCAQAKLGPGSSALLQQVELRYSYAGFFTRTQSITLPRTPTLRC